MNDQKPETRGQPDFPPRKALLLPPGPAPSLISHSTLHFPEVSLRARAWEPRLHSVAAQPVSRSLDVIVK